MIIAGILIRNMISRYCLYTVHILMRAGECAGSENYETPRLGDVVLMGENILRPETRGN